MPVAYAVQVQSRNKSNYVQHPNEASDVSTKKIIIYVLWIVSYIQQTYGLCHIINSNLKYVGPGHI